MVPLNDAEIGCVIAREVFNGILLFSWFWGGGLWFAVFWGCVSGRQGWPQTWCAAEDDLALLLPSPTITNLYHQPTDESFYPLEQPSPPLDRQIEQSRLLRQRISVSVHHTKLGYAALTNDFTNLGAFKL